MPDLAQLGMQFTVQGAEQATRALDDVATKAPNAEAAVDGLASANQKASSSFGQLGSAIASSLRQVMDFTRGVRDGMTQELAAMRQTQAAAAGQRDHADAVNLNRFQVMELTHVLRSMVDGLAAGASPMRLLTMEGGRLYQALSMGEGGLGGGLRALTGVLGKFAPALAGVAAAAGVAFGGAALAARRLNQENGDLISQMDLSERQLERLSDQGTKTAITLGDVFKGTFDFIKSLLDRNTSDTQSWLSRMLDNITNFAVKFAEGAVGAFSGGFYVIKTIWQELPKVIGEAITGAVNEVLKGVEHMINAVRPQLNDFISKANALDKSVLGSHAAVVPTIPEMHFQPFANPNAGAGGRLGQSLSVGNVASVERGGVDEFKRLGKDWADHIVDAAQKRLEDAAGRREKDPKQPKEKQPPRDMTDEMQARVAGQELQAQQAALQAQLGLTKDIIQRGQIQKQINDIETQVKQTEIDKEIASIDDMKGISDATRKELKARLQGVQTQLALVGEQKNALVDQQTMEAYNKQAITVAQAAGQDRIDLLQAQQNAAITDRQQFDASLKVQQAQFDLETQRLKDTTLVNGYSQQEVTIAKERLLVLPQIQAAERQQLLNSRKLVDDFNDAKKSVDDFVSAFKSGDIANGVQKLIDAIAKAAASLSDAGTSLASKMQTIGGLISGIAGMFGGGKGVLGGALNGIGQGLSVAGTVSGALGSGGALSFLGLGSMAGPLGIAAGAVAGLGSLFGNLFGGAAKAQQARRDSENQAASQFVQQDQAHQQQIQQEQQQLELRLVTASGDAMAILNTQRAQELDGLDKSNQAMAKQVYAAEDQKNRSDQVHQMELTYLDMESKATGSAAGALALLNAQRQDELKAIDATLQPLQRMVYAAQDAVTAFTNARQQLDASYQATLATQQQTATDLETARTAARAVLVTAYQTESTALTDLITKMSDFSKSLHAFRASLDTGSAAGLSPQDQYATTQAQFNDTSRRAQLGDQTAMGDFQSSAQSFLTASLAYNGQNTAYFRDLAAVKDATEKAAATADRTASNAQQQLDELTKTVGAVIKLDGDTLSVEDAIKNLQDARAAAYQAELQVYWTQQQYNATIGVGQAVMSLSDAIAAYQQAQANQTAAIQALAQAVAAAKANPANQTPGVPANAGQGKGYQSTNGDYVAYVEGNPDLKALYQSGGGMAKGRTEEEFGVYHWANFGVHENRPVRPYAHGGGFMVGGAGGTDSQLVQFAASPDEHVTVETPEMMQRGAAAQERVAAALEKLVAQGETAHVERRADKTQRAAIHRETLGALGELGDNFETGTRRARKAAAR